MGTTIFFSWQSDLSETRNVIRVALDRAVGGLNRDVSLEEPFRVDEDTAGVAGWPEITSTILDKIERCEVFVADITPVNGPCSDFRLTPNPNVLFELGYALATGMGRTRIICIVNTSYLPRDDLKELPFDVRGSRPLTLNLEDPLTRGVTQGQEDPVRIRARNELTNKIQRSLNETFQAIELERTNRLLTVTPHLATENLEKFQVVLDVKTSVPFQIDYNVTEPSGNLLSGFMTHPTSFDPEGSRRVRFRVINLKPLTEGNSIYVLSGNVAHVQSNERPAPQFYPFEVRYLSTGKGLLEVSRKQPPAH